jgi:hypothetical protein
MADELTTPPLRTHFAPALTEPYRPRSAPIAADAQRVEATKTDIVEKADIVEAAICWVDVKKAAQPSKP